MSIRLMTLLSVLAISAGCELPQRTADTGSGNDAVQKLPPTLARMRDHYEDLRNGRFVCLADFNTLAQATLFRMVDGAGRETNNQPGISVRQSIDETGAGGLKVRLNDPGDRILFDGKRSDKLALVRDWSNYNLLLFNIHGPSDGLLLEFSVESGTDTPLSTTRKLFAKPGWHLYRFDIADLGEEIDIVDIRALSWRAPELTEPAELYFDDFLLTDNTRALLGADAGEGELYVSSAGRRIMVGARGRFELAFTDGMIVEWHAGGHRNLTVRSGLGPWPVPLPEDWHQRRANPVVYDDPNLFANWGKQAATAQRIVEQSQHRIVLEGIWRFGAAADKDLADPDSMPEHVWRWTIYPSGQVYLNVRSSPGDRSWSDSRLGYAIAIDGRGGFQRVAPNPGSGNADDVNFVLMSQPGREKPDLLWCGHEPAVIRRQLELISEDGRRIAVTAGDIPAGGVIETAHLLRFWPRDLDAIVEAESIAGDYQHPARLAAARGQVVTDAAGDLDGDGFNESEGCYELALDNGLLRFDFLPETRLRHEPLFRVRGTAGKTCWVYAEGRIISAEGRDRNGNLMFGLPRAISRPLTIEVNTQAASS